MGHCIEVLTIEEVSLKVLQNQVPQKYYNRGATKVIGSVIENIGSETPPIILRLQHAQQACFNDTFYIMVFNANLL